MKMLSIYTIMIMPLILLLINSLPSFYKNLHPVLMGSILLMYSMKVSLNISVYKDSSWWSMISFLIVVGGLMVLFLYFTSFISNNLMMIKLNSMKSMIFKFSLIMIFFMVLLNTKDIMIMWNNNSTEICNNKLMISKNTNNMDTMKTSMLFSPNINKNMIIPLLYIILILYMLVKMILSNKFTLRKMN